MIFVERPRELCAEPLIGQTQHFQDHEPAGAVRLDFVSDAHGPAGSRLRPVDLDLPCLASVVRQRPGFENPGRTQPAIDADLVHLRQTRSIARQRAPGATCWDQVNFFGHAVVACWFDRSPAFVLGAMLPDLSAMLRLRPPHAAESLLARGIALHHATDAAFHSAPAFLGMQDRARVALSELGLGRGPARAIAHIGTEILLDESLGRDPAVERAYLAALHASDTELAGLEAQLDANRLRRLAYDLAARGVSRNSEPGLVARRLKRALETHPRLSFGDRDEPLVAAWVACSRPQIAAEADAVVTQLRSRLASPAEA